MYCGRLSLIGIRLINYTCVFEIGTTVIQSVLVCLNMSESTEFRIHISVEQYTRFFVVADSDLDSDFDNISDVGNVR